MRRLHLTDDQQAVLAELRDANAAELVRLRFNEAESDQSQIRSHVHFRAKVYLLQELLADDFPTLE